MSAKIPHPKYKWAKNKQAAVGGTQEEWVIEYDELMEKKCKIAIKCGLFDEHIVDLGFVKSLSNMSKAYVYGTAITLYDALNVEGKKLDFAFDVISRDMGVSRKKLEEIRKKMKSMMDPEYDRIDKELRKYYK